MTFLNWTILFGLIGVSIPIIIHLLNRRRAKTVEWGAMQFLLASLASRNRRIMIEEMILMALRCLVVALLVLAMARPFLPARSTVPWPIVVPAVLIAAMCIGVAAAMWSLRRARWILLAVAVGLLGLAGASAAMEHWTQLRRWSSGAGAQDIVIIIDGSASMKLEVEGKANFARAVAEARTLVELRRSDDAIALLVAGAVPRPVLPTPTNSDQDITAALDELRPTGGSMRVLEALNAAAAALGAGHNPGKQIVLITDAQDLGWDLRSEARWRFLAAGLGNLPSKPKVICRRLAMPETFRNAAITDVTLSRKLIGTDRPAEIDVKVMNTGSVPLEGLTVELSVDGLAAAQRDLQPLAPNAAETVSFSHRFQRPGPRVVTAKITGADELADDNVSHRVVHVLDKLRVLIVDGASEARLLGGAAYLAVALSPPPEERDDAPRRRRRRKDEILGRLIEPRVVLASRLASVDNLRDYAVVILADVPKLPAKFAAALIAFVADGGGLLIAPGERAKLSAADTAGVRTFYNEWEDLAGRPIAPARLVERRSVENDPAHPAIRTFSHPALALVADEGHSDLPAARVTAYWRLEADEKDPAVRVAALLDSGDPLIVERKVGKGHVIVTAVSLDLRDGSLPLMQNFVPMVQELAYYLAGPLTPEGNVECGAEVAAELTLRPGASAKEVPREIIEGGIIDVDTPSGQRSAGAILGADETLRLRFDATHEPGLYRFKLPARLAAVYPPMSAEGDALPFVALTRADESLLTRLPDEALDAVSDYVEFVPAETLDELTAIVAGTVPGEELWKVLALAALLGLLGEIFLTRWIAVQRRSHAIQTVSFAVEAVDIEAFRAHARDMLNPDPEPAPNSQRT